MGIDFLVAAVGVFLIGLIIMAAALLRLNGAHEILFVAAVWALSSAASRLVVYSGRSSAEDALTFTGTLSFGILPTILWILWRNRR